MGRRQNQHFASQSAGLICAGSTGRSPKPEFHKFGKSNQNAHGDLPHRAHLQALLRMRPLNDTCVIAAERVQPSSPECLR